MAISIFANSTSKMIQEYAGLSRHESAFFNAVWKQIWQGDLEAEEILSKYRRSLSIIGVGILKNGVKAKISAPFFYHLINPLLIDMFKSPFERKFLKKLFSRVNELQHHICIQIADRACIECMIDKKNNRVTYILNFNLQMRPKFFAKDESGRHHTFIPSLRRILSHELVHIYHMVLGVFHRYCDLPLSKRWQWGYEMMAITGFIRLRTNQGTIVYSHPYSENSFAKQSGEMERILYMHAPLTNVKTISAAVEETIRFGTDGDLENLNFNAAQLNFLGLVTAFKQSPYPDELATHPSCPMIDAPFERELQQAKVRTMRKLIFMIQQQGYDFIASALKRATIDLL